MSEENSKNQKNQEKIIDAIHNLQKKLLELSIEFKTKQPKSPTVGFF